MLTPDAVAAKVCPTCGAEKPHAEYYKSKNRRDGMSWECATCVKARVMSHYNLDRSRAYRAKHKEKYDDLARRNRLATFGITPAEYDQMLAAQGGVCAICGGGEWSTRRLAVDHCHKTGKVRGILCSHCNVTLGQMKENPQALRAAADYLEMHSAVS